MPHKINNTVIEVIKDDITMLDVEAIVNPANNYLIHGGGLAAAIVRRGGQIIQQESKKIGFVPTGHAVYTTGGHLKAGYVIHAVGPRYKDGKSGEPEKLASAAKTALDIADKKKLKSVALPAISSGIFGYPIGACAEVITKAVTEFISGTPETTLEKVILCMFDDDAFGEFEKQLQSIPVVKAKPAGKTKGRKKEEPKLEEHAKEHKREEEKIKPTEWKVKSPKVKAEKPKTSAKTRQAGTSVKRISK
jgi:O-acetyl-ADP-ribose deacetylase (regulator of RNase III)